MTPSTPSSAKSTLICGVIGMGYVGLPLALEMIRAGYSVIGVDVSAEKVAGLKKGRSYIGDIQDVALENAIASGRFDASTSYARLAAADCVSICVPTPLRKTKDPDLSFIVNSARALAPHLKKGALVILESTTYPGTTDELVLPILEEGGRKVGKDFFLAFSPERVDPGNPTWKTRNTPKIIGGVTADCTRRAEEIYSKVVEHVVPVSSTRAAEMVKLLENTYRAVNIGLVNEMALMCHKLNLDVWEIINAAATKPFGFMPFYPGPGLGGHCIPIDPLYLSWKLKSLNYTARFIELASEINTRMPQVVVERVMRALSRRGVPLKGAKIHLMGVAYKRDVSDFRESPALDVLFLLEQEGAKLSYSDPHVPEINMEGMELKSKSPTVKLLQSMDAVIITTDHKAFDMAEVVKNSKFVFDTRNATAKVGKKKNVERL